MIDWNNDEWQKGTVEHPRYMVKVDRTAMPFYNIEYAMAWQEQIYKDTKLETTIIDLTNYDWVSNPGNIKFHKLR
jgi:hypothetical protein